jgi:phosphate transport system protein
MARRTAEALEHAMEALKTQNAEQARSVIDADLEQNQRLRLIEQECLEILATLEPKASDLRDVVAGLQIASELERIADHAKDIAKIVLGMDPSDFSGPMDRISAMGDLCQTMLTQVMEAYENLDVDLARSVTEHDCEVDELDEAACASLMMQLMTSPDTTMHATHLLWIAYHLERIGDRITNIAERVIFVVTAETPEVG